MGSLQPGNTMKGQNLENQLQHMHELNESSAEKETLIAELEELDKQNQEATQVKNIREGQEYCVIYKRCAFVFKISVQQNYKSF